MLNNCQAKVCKKLSDEFAGLLILSSNEAPGNQKSDSIKEQWKSDPGWSQADFNPKKNKR